MSTPESAEMTARQNRTSLIVSIAGFMIGVALAAWGAEMALFRLNLARHGETATGVVVALEREKSRGSTGKPAWYPVVEYRTRDGRTVKFRDRTGRSSPGYAEGDRVLVTYLPDAPRQALISEGSLAWLMPGVLLFFGSGLAIASLRGIQSARRRLRQAG